MIVRLHAPESDVTLVSETNVLIWCLGSNLSWSVGLSNLHETNDIALLAPQGAHYHGDVVYIKVGNKEDMVFRVRFTPTLFLL